MVDESSNGFDRRRVLATMAAVTGGVAASGCSALQGRWGWDQTGATDVVLTNAAAEPQTVSITITDASADDPHTSRTLEVVPNETVDPVNRSKLPTNASYTVEAAVEDGPSETFEWKDPALELAPLWVLVDGTRNIKFLLQAG